MTHPTVDQLRKVVADPDFALVAEVVGGQVMTVNGVKRVVSAWVDPSQEAIVVWKIRGPQEMVTVPFFVDGELIQVPVLIQETVNRIKP